MEQRREEREKKRLAEEHDKRLVIAHEERQKAHGVWLRSTTRHRSGSLRNTIRRRSAAHARLPRPRSQGGGAH